MPERIQLSRRKGWRKPEGAIVVARPSKWGNPYTLAELRIDYPGADVEELRRMATSDFRVMLEGKWGEDRGDYPLVTELAGHDLACWCPLDQPCHADVLLELANAT